MKYLFALWFNVVFYTANLVLSSLLSLSLLFPRRIVVKAVLIWLGGVAWIESHICGIKYRVIGKENIPKGACIVASKHQSEWETFKIHLIFNDPAIVLKKELLKIPLIGPYMRLSGSIAIDRSAGARAIILMLNDAKKAAAEGRPIVIFPEGTRVAIGESRPYKPGVAALYEKLNLPIVPMSLNSGLLWSKNTFFKKPGTVTVEISPPIPAGLPRDEMMKRLRNTLETTTDILVKEAQKE